MMTWRAAETSAAGSRRAARASRPFGGHFVVVVPYLDLVVVHRVDTDVQNRYVTLSQFGRLMQLIVDARK